MMYGYEGFFVDSECDSVIKGAQGFNLSVVEKEATGDKAYGLDGEEIRILLHGSKKDLMAWLNKTLKEEMVGGPSVPDDDEIEEMIFEV